LDGSGEEERKGKAAGRGEICGSAGPGEAEGGEEERKATGEGLTGGAGSSAKQNEKEPGAWAAAGKRLVGCWAAGPEGEKVSFLFFFFFKLFSNQTFKLKIKSNFF
jgi:hypothetical protein